jgi:hypothetical protein
MMKRECKYDFVVIQATLAAVGFYERVGFRRVGAVARYAEAGVQLAERPVTAYRHWAEANTSDELMAAEFGGASYLMALDLKSWAPPGGVLKPHIVDAYPKVRHTLESL